MIPIDDWKRTPSWRRASNPPPYEKEEVFALCLMWFLIGAGVAMAGVEVTAWFCR